MELYIYDRTTGLQGIIDNATSIRWRRKYYEPGEVEIHVPATKEYMDLLKEERVVRRTDRREAAIITGLEVTENDMAITGRMLSFLLDKAILSKRYSMNKTAEAAMKALIAEGTRVVPDLTAAAVKGVGDARVDFQATYKNLLTTEQRIARASGLGFMVEFQDVGAMVFDVYEGVDRSVAQSARPWVVFSDEFGNLAAPRYTRTSTDYKTRAYVGGQGEGPDRVVVVVDKTPPGEEAREMFVDAKDIQMEDGMTTEVYEALLRQRGLDKLAECRRVECFEGDGENVSNFEYLTDWDLGDIVTVQYTKLGITMHERVTEVEEVFERGVVTYTPTFGDPLPEKINLGDETE